MLVAENLTPEPYGRIGEVDWFLRDGLLWLVDRNNNRFSIELPEDKFGNLSYTVACYLREFKKLRNCKNCTNCHDCGGCVGCVNCFNCLRCTNCVDCAQLKNCIGCELCRDCHDLSNCVLCISCSHLQNCRACSSVACGSACFDVNSAAYVIRCSSSVTLYYCEDCHNCSHLENAHSCRTLCCEKFTSGVSFNLDDIFGRQALNTLRKSLQEEVSTSLVADPLKFSRACSSICIRTSVVHFLTSSQNHKSVSKSTLLELTGETAHGPLTRYDYGSRFGSAMAVVVASVCQSMGHSVLISPMARDTCLLTIDELRAIAGHKHTQNKKHHLVHSFANRKVESS